jgi:hypothetical protein
MMPLLLGVAGCQLVAGVETRKLDPLANGCALPSVGDAHIRVANLVTSNDKVDFCVRTTGGSYFRPVLRGGGTSCPNGYAYGELSAPFAAPAGKLDVKAIASGQTCSAPALSEVIGVNVSADVGVTFARIGGGAVPEQLVTSRETTLVDPNTQKIRVLHAINGVGPLYFGTSSNARLPAAIETRFETDPIPYGGGLKPNGQTINGFSIDENGYFIGPAAAVVFGLAKDGDTKALLIEATTRASERRSLFAIGDPSTIAFPVRGLACEDGALTSDGLQTSCVFTPLPTLSVDTFNATLYGGGAPEESARRAAILANVPKRTSDVMCLLELSNIDDRNAIAAAAKSSFPYSYMVTTDLNTLPTDPSDAHGNVPALQTTPPCAPSNAMDVDATLACIKAKGCEDANDTIKSGGGQCVAQCAVSFLPLLNDAPRCWDCLLVDLLSYHPAPAVKTRCETDPRDGYNFDGQTPSMVLSRYPLMNADAFILPSWAYRRAVIYAELALEQGTTVDFYCAQMPSVTISTVVPYAGYYGNGGGTSEDSYRQEQLLAATKTIAWMKQKSGDRPAILAGDWHGTPRSGHTVDDILTLLRNTKELTEALPPNATLPCTYCASPQNKYNSTESYTWLDTFLYKFGAASAPEAGVFFDDPTLAALSDGTHGPLSETYGWNVRVVRP